MIGLSTSHPPSNHPLRSPQLQAPRRNHRRRIERSTLFYTPPSSSLPSGLPWRTGYERSARLCTESREGTLRTKPTVQENADETSSAPRAGFAVRMTNPKAAAFFASFFVTVLPPMAPIWLNLEFWGSIGCCIPSDTSRREAALRLLARRRLRDLWRSG